jgi:DNA transformation protein
MHDEFLTYVLDTIGPRLAVRTRRMFGAVALFHRERMFGFVDEDRLYLKVNDTNRGAFAAAGSEPFIYRRAGKAMALSYWSIPESALDDADEFRRFVDLAVAAAAARGAKPAKSHRRQR